MAREDSENKKDRGSDLGATAGREAGKRAGQSVGTSVGTASGGGSSAAAAGGTATGAAAGTSAGAAGGPAAPITVPAGAIAGSVVGRYWKKVALALIGVVGGCFTLVILLLIVPIIVVILVFLGWFGGFGAGSAAPPPSSTITPGAGLVDNFCLGSSATCSTELKKLLEAASSSFKIPAGVLGGILSIEGPHVFGYSNTEITNYGLTEGGQDPINSAPNVCGAVGPMQFLTGSGGNSSCPNPDALTSDVWSSYKNAVNEATGSTRVTLVQNIMDALYGGAKKLRTDATAARVPADKVLWTKEEVFAAAGAYSGACVVGTFQYCQIVWDYYLNNANTGLGGDGTLPNGWPSGGTVTQGPYDPFSHGFGTTEASAIDIACAVVSSTDTACAVRTPIYATQDGTLVQFKFSGNIEVSILGARYLTINEHLDSYSSCASDGFVRRGTVIGYVGNTGRLTTGPHDHYQINNLANTVISLEEFNALVPTYTVGANIEASYTGSCP